MIKVFSFINGREIIGEVAEETATGYVVEKAVLINLVMPTEDDPRPGVQFIPVSAFTEQSNSGSTFTVNKSAITLEPWRPNDEIIAMYKQQTSPIIQNAQNFSNITSGFTRN